MTTTERAATLAPRARPRVAAVVLAVLLPVLLWTGTGNTFAAHMGPGADAPRQEAAVSHGPVPHDAESSHVLHLLGGCVAVLGAALLLLGAGVERERPTSAASSTPGSAPLQRHARSWWRPPALSPPTTSAVLRT